MSKNIKLVFCELPDTPRGFDVEKFKAGDPEQKLLYKGAKTPIQTSKLTYEEVTDETKPKNYARFVPEDCVFIDFDTPEEAKEMKEILEHSGLKYLELKTIKGYHFLFRKPDFFKKEMTGATNWFGYKFDTKGSFRKPDKKLQKAVQIIRVCGMTRDERISWGDKDLIEPEVIDVEALDILPYWLWGKLSEKDLHKGGKPRRK